MPRFDSHISLLQENKRSSKITKEHRTQLRLKTDEPKHDIKQQAHAGAGGKRKKHELLQETNNQAATQP